eukprot:Amastigsp_a340121_174.p2 type:complete len:235 gc:universal Amastigsp_a340121_174:106-810(+)
MGLCGLKQALNTGVEERPSDEVGVDLRDALVHTRREPRIVRSIQNHVGVEPPVPARQSHFFRFVHPVPEPEGDPGRQPHGVPEHGLGELANVLRGLNVDAAAEQKLAVPTKAKPYLQHVSACQHRLERLQNGAGRVEHKDPRLKRGRKLENMRAIVCAPMVPLRVPAHKAKALNELLGDRGSHLGVIHDRNRFGGRVLQAAKVEQLKSPHLVQVVVPKCQQRKALQFANFVSRA